MDAGRCWSIFRVWRLGCRRVRRSIVATRTLGGLVGGPASDGRLGRARTRGGVENRDERLLEFVLSGRRDEGAARRRRHASERLEARGLVVQADHMDAQALAFLFQRGCGRADIGIAAIAAVGDQHDFELRIRPWSVLVASLRAAATGAAPFGLMAPSVFACVSAVSAPGLATISLSAQFDALR